MVSETMIESSYPGSAPTLADPTYSRVREKLRQDILSGVYVQGQRLKIADLTSRYGVSQMPIREALQQLQGEGLITIEPNKGAQVRSVDRHFVENILDIRRLIEVYLTLRSVAAISGRVLKELWHIQESYEKAAAEEDYASCVKFNRQFHAIIYELADNQEAYKIIEHHWQLVNGIRLNYGFGRERTSQVIEEHRRILRALEEKDLRELEDAASMHCLKAKEDLINQMTVGK